MSTEEATHPSALHPELDQRLRLMELGLSQLLTYAHASAGEQQALRERLAKVESELAQLRQRCVACRGAS